MSVNRYKPHVLVLPEDDANRQLANGFLMHPDLSARAVQVLEEAGGWHEVLSRFFKEHVDSMNRYTGRYMVLVIDFDNSRERLQEAKGQIPRNLVERVFIIGTLSEPEELKQALLSTYEQIGCKLAQDCWDKTESTWGHPLLTHNAAELARLRHALRPILFPDASNF